LFRGVEPIPLGRRAVVVLRVLVERSGAPVSKQALMDAAWPGLAVEDSNLVVQIAALRRVLGEAPGGDRWIETCRDAVTGSSVRPGSRSKGPLTRELGTREPGTRASFPLHHGLPILQWPPTRRV